MITIRLILKLDFKAAKRHSFKVVFVWPEKSIKSQFIRRKSKKNKCPG